MPRISAFYGIAIYMYYRDHAPPHFHAIYGEYEATVAIETAELLEGQLPPHHPAPRLGMGRSPAGRIGTFLGVGACQPASADDRGAGVETGRRL